MGTGGTNHCRTSVDSVPPTGGLGAARDTQYMWDASDVWGQVVGVCVRWECVANRRGILLGVEE